MAGNRKIRKSAEKAVKKMHPAAVVFALLFLFIGAAGGYFLAREVTKNDTFALLGEKNIALESGETYVEPGVRIISFGKDISD